MEEIDLKELFSMFSSRKLQIILITAIFLVAGIIYSYVFVEPDYDAVTTVVLAQQNSKTSSGQTDATITASDLTLNQKLVSTYSELIKSKNVLSEVIYNLKIDRTEEEIKNRITVSTVKDTDLIKIRVTDEDPVLATKIVTEIANVFIDKVANGVYNINNVQIWDKAEIQSTPYNINHTKDMIMSAFVGLVVAAGYVFIANMLDTTIKSREVVENKIGLPVLTSIPLCDFDYSMKKFKKKGGRN